MYGQLSEYCDLTMINKISHPAGTQSHPGQSWVSGPSPSFSGPGVFFYIYFPCTHTWGWSVRECWSTYRNLSIFPSNSIYSSQPGLFRFCS